MTARTNKLEEFLSYAVAGSLIGLVLRKRNIPFPALAHPEGMYASEPIQAIATELNDLGLDAELLASQFLVALVSLLAQEQNADLITTQFTGLLWSILGDPENGGSPPELYRRAGVAMHLSLLEILHPSVLDKHSQL